MSSRERLREIWKARVEAYQASGERATEWCATHNVTPRQLWYWIRKFKDEQKSPTTSGTDGVTVQVEPDLAETASSIIVRVGSAAIEVKPGYNPSLLKDVVRTLTAIC